MYVNINFNAFETLPDFKILGAELAMAQVAFGGRWFELPSQVLNSFVPPHATSKAKAVEDRATIAKIIDAVTNFVDTTPFKDLGHGSYSESGSLLSLARALYPSLTTFGKITTPTAKEAKGTYTFSISTSGSSTTGASISVTSPNSKKVNVTETLMVTIAHANEAVTAPSGATVLTSTMIRQLLSRGTKHKVGFSQSGGFDQLGKLVVGRM